MHRGASDRDFLGYHNTDHMEIFSMKRTIMSTDQEPVILMRHINNIDTISVKQRQYHSYWREQQRPSVRRHFFFFKQMLLLEVTWTKSADM